MAPLNQHICAQPASTASNLSIINAIAQQIYSPGEKSANLFSCSTSHPPSKFPPSPKPLNPFYCFQYRQQCSFGVSNKENTTSFPATSTKQFHFLTDLVLGSPGVWLKPIESKEYFCVMHESFGLNSWGGTVFFLQLFLPKQTLEKYPTNEFTAIFLWPSLMIAQCLLLSVQPILQITEFAASLAACYIYRAVIKIT